MNEVTNNSVSNDFMRVLLALKKSTLRDCNVAEVCQVTNIKDETYTCNIISSGQICTALTLKDLEVQLYDTVLVIFTNTDFRYNLKQLKNGKRIYPITSDGVHSKSFGVIVGII